MKSERLLKSCILVLLACLFPLCTACESVVLNADAVGGDLYINEVMSSNAHTLTDEVLGTPDWIELYNASAAPIDLSGYGLSDNIKEPHKWTFPNMTLGPGEYLLVYACKAQTDLCTGFGLAKAGETLYLSDSYYNMLQVLEIPALEADISYARTGDGRFGYCAAPTPGKPNGDDIVTSLSEIAYAGSDALRISEVLPQNAHVLAAQDGGYYPYVELENISASPVALSGFYLSDDRADPTKWQLPDVSVAPGGFAVVYMSGKDKSGDELHASFKLGKTDDAIYLSDSQGAICASLVWPLDLLADIAVVGADLYTGFPTPGAENSAATFSQTTLTPMDASDPVRINEVLVRNRYSAMDEDGDRGAWVELVNTSAQSVSLAGYCLSDNAEDPMKWSFPDECSIEANGYVLVYLDGKDRADAYLHTPFTLSLDDGVVLLTNKAGLRCDKIDIDPALGQNISIGLDANGALMYFTTPTPGAKNSTHAFETMGTVAVCDPSGVYISEVCAANLAKSGKADWIELHNATGQEVNLEGWHITDDPDDLYAFTLPDFKIPAGGYAVLYASTRSGKQEGVTAPFGISDGGETLILTDHRGDIRDIFETGVLRAGVTAGRVSGSTARVFFNTATKAAANSEASLPSYTLTPILSDDTLYHTEAFSLSIDCPTEGATLYYTTDGSKPTTGSSVYTGPLSISQNTILKVKATKDGLLDSEMVTATYLFEQKHTLPVVCLSTDSESFDQVYSVIDRWEKVEREGYCAYYPSDGTLGVAFPCGLRVSGASTLLARQKSFTVFLRTGYGVGETRYPFFPGNSVSVYKSLNLRNSGQDRGKARMRDSLFAQAVEGLHIETVKTRPVIVYINAQYWGIYDLNENQNEDFMATHYGVDPDAVDIIRRNETRLAGDKYEMKRVRSYALNTDLSDDAKYAELVKCVDVDYFTDYVIAQTYFANGDMFNQKYWRSQDYTLKWRPIFFDLDLAFSSCNPSRNILPSYFKYEGVPSQDGSLTNMDIFVGLRKNAGWCDQFCGRYAYVAYNILTPERITKLIDAMRDALEPEMSRHIQKWGSPSSVSSWKKEVQDLRDCIEKRRDYALKALKSEFSLTDAQLKTYVDAAQSGQQASGVITSAPPSTSTQSVDAATNEVADAGLGPFVQP